MVGANMFHALRVRAKADAPLRLDRAGRRLVEHVDDRLAMPLGKLLKRRRRGRSSTRVAVAIERHIGQAAVRGDWWRLPFRQLERRHIGR